VRLLSFGQPDPALADALTEEGFEVEVRALSDPGGDEATGALAGALREGRRPWRRRLPTRSS
jgi:hypothetical protein